MGDYSGDNLIFNGHNKLDVTSGDIEIALKRLHAHVQADSHSGEWTSQITLRSQRITH